LVFKGINSLSVEYYGNGDNLLKLMKAVLRRVRWIMQSDREGGVGKCKGSENEEKKDEKSLFEKE
jgi:hypothetical protein